MGDINIYWLEVVNFIGISQLVVVFFPKLRRNFDDKPLLLSANGLNFTADVVLTKADFELDKNLFLLLPAWLLSLAFGNLMKADVSLENIPYPSQAIILHKISTEHTVIDITSEGEL